MGRRPQGRAQYHPVNFFEQTPDRPNPQVGIKKRYYLRIFGYRISLLSLVLLIIFCSVLYHIIVGLHGLVMNYLKLAESERAIEERTRMKQALEMEKELWKTDEYLEGEARKLGLIKPGELFSSETEANEE